MAITNHERADKTLGHAERTLVSELGEVRNRWAHQRPFSTDDAFYTSVSAGLNAGGY